MLHELVETSILISALAGAGSFFSPCILPIIPAFVSYLSGTTLSEIQSQNQSLSGASLAMKKSTRLNIFLNTVYFVLGFSLVFAIMGVVLNSFLANVGTGFQTTFQVIGGAVIIAFGGYLILSMKLRILNFEKRMRNLPRFKTTYLTSFVFGAGHPAWARYLGRLLLWPPRLLAPPTIYFSHIHLDLACRSS
jgi:cytochrome c-type biogenesis protein